MTGRVRRTLALLFAIAVAGTIITPLRFRAAIAHASWDDEAGQARAAQRMAMLGLIPDAEGLSVKMTRVDAVMLLVRAFGKEHDARLLQGTPSFNDVPSDHPASGYMTMAKFIVEQAGSGLSLADSDGNFRPADDLHVHDALLFLMAFLGVARDASEPPPDDLLAGALQAGLISADMAASLRGDIEADRAATRGHFFAVADYVFYHFPIAEGKTVYTTYVDSDPPSLDISTYEPTVVGSFATVAGTVSGAVELTVGGIDTPIADDGAFTVVVPLTLGDNHIAVVAIDLAGNRTGRVITVRSAGVQYGQTATATLTLLDGDGNAIAHVPVTVSSTGTTDAETELTTDANGAVTWSFTALAPVGSGYEVTATFAGNDSYAPALAVVPFEIVPRDIVLALPDTLSGTVGQPLELSATVLTKDTRVPVSGVPITFTFQGQSATSAPSDGEGKARVTLTPVQAGEGLPYTASHSPLAGSNYAAAMNEHGVNVAKQPVRAAAHDVAVAFGSSATLTASFEKNDGAAWIPLDAGTTVTLTAPGLGLHGQPVTIGEQGVASFVVTSPELGTYTFAFALSGHEAFADAATGDHTLTVSQRATQLQTDLADDPDLTYGEDFAVTITLTDDAGPLAEEEVYYTLEPDEALSELAAVRQAVQTLASAAPVGDSGKTDSDGRITFRIRPSSAGTFKLTIGFAGNAHSLPQTSVRSLRVKKQPTTLTATGATVFVNRKATVAALLTGTLSGRLDGMPLTFTEPVLGTYAATTAAGSATITATPTAPGTFTVVIRFAGDDNFLPSETTALVTVHAPTPPPPPASGAGSDGTIHPPVTAVDPGAPASGPGSPAAGSDVPGVESSAPNLPYTGGTYVWYVLAGAALTAGGAVGLLVRRRYRAG